MKTKWENIQILVSGGGSTAVSDALNKMGDEGWEAWHMIERPDSAFIFLKRPKSAILAPDLSTANGHRR